MSGILRSKGIDVRRFRPTFKFNPNKVWIEPENAEIPGCFRLIARDVSIKETVDSLTAEFELRIAENPDPDEEPMQCRRRNDSCPCGTDNAWFVCGLAVPPTIAE